MIINAASVQGLIGIAIKGGIAHAATNAGVIAMTRQMAAEGAPHGVRANSISPETVATPATTEAFAHQDMSNAGRWRRASQRAFANLAGGQVI